MSEAANDEKGYERVGRLLYGLQRICGGVDGLRGLAHDARVASDTARRGAALADRYDLLLARCTRDVEEVGSQEVDAFLGDARALGDEVTGQCRDGWPWARG
jgi:hypothetical protein